MKRFYLWLRLTQTRQKNMDTSSATEAKQKSQENMGYSKVRKRGSIVISKA